MISFMGEFEQRCIGNVLCSHADMRSLKTPGAATDPMKISCVQTFPLCGIALKVKYVGCVSVCVYLHIRCEP